MNEAEFSNYSMFAANGIFAVIEALAARNLSVAGESHVMCSKYVLYHDHAPSRQIETDM